MIMLVSVTGNVLQVTDSSMSVTGMQLHAGAGSFARNSSGIPVQGINDTYISQINVLYGNGANQPKTMICGNSQLYYDFSVAGNFMGSYGMFTI